MHGIAEKRRRFGDRRVGILSERRGMVMSETKPCQRCREEGLPVGRHRSRKRARSSRLSIPVPLRPTGRRSPDPRHGRSDRWRDHGALSGSCARGLPQVPHPGGHRRWPPRDPRPERRHPHLWGRDLGGLDALVRVCANPACIVGDNGTEVAGAAILNRRSAKRIGSTTIVSNGTTPLRAGRSRSAASTASAAACTTRARTMRSSTAWPMPAESRRLGASTATASGRILRRAIGPRQKRAGRSSNPQARPPARSPDPMPTTVRPGDAPRDRGPAGGKAVCAPG